MSVKIIYERIKLLNPAVMMLLIGCYCVFTLIRNNIWQSEYDLSRDSIGKSPSKARPYLNLGLHYFRKGLIDDAIREYLISVRLWPGYAHARNNLGVAYYKKGFIDRAIVEFQEAVRLIPDYAEAHYNLGVAYGDKGLTNEAYDEIKRGMKFNKGLIDELKKDE